MKNIDELIGRIKLTVDNHFLGEEGKYCRWLWQSEENNRKLGINEYGCADAANILYTINAFVSEPKKREQWVRVLRGFQNKETGLFVEATHHPIHTTAHCVAALELFDASVEYPLYDFQQYTSLEAIYEFMEKLDWNRDPWNASHQGAGLYAALKLTNMVDLEWERAYFQWLWNNQDPETGMWRKGFTLSGDAPLPWHLAGTFHYLFNVEYAKQSLRYSEKIIDTCLDIYESKELGRKRSDPSINIFGRRVSFLEIDWVYVLSRANRRSGYRTEDCKKAIRKFAREYLEWLYSLDYKTHDGFNDLHLLFGSCCALAEIQQFLVGEYETSKPLRLVLDRRPFI